MFACSRGCRWSGHSRAHCSVCHQTFGSVTYFDKHRVKGSCKHPSTVRANGTYLTSNDKGVWITTCQGG